MALLTVTQVHSLFAPASSAAEAAAADARPRIEVEELEVELAGEMGSVTSGQTPSRKRLLRDIEIKGEAEEGGAEEGEAEGGEAEEGAGAQPGAAEAGAEAEEGEEAEAKARAAEAGGAEAGGAEAGGEAEAEGEKGEAEAGTGVEASGCGFTVTLGNHSTNARYFLPDKHEASQLLGMLAAEDAGDAAPVRRRERALPPPPVEAEQARLPNAMEVSQLQIIQEHLSNYCWTPCPRPCPCPCPYPYPYP